MANNASKLKVWSSGAAPTPATVTADYTMQHLDRTILIDTTNNPVTVTLGDAEYYEGRPLAVVWIAGTNQAKVVAGPGDTIDGDAEYVFGEVGEALQLTATV